MPQVLLVLCSFRQKQLDELSGRAVRQRHYQLKNIFFAGTEDCKSSPQMFYFEKCESK